MNTNIHITMHIDEKMPHKRIDITLPQEEIDKLDRICKKRGYMHKSKRKKEEGKLKPKRSTMLARIIQEYKE